MCLCAPPQPPPALLSPFPPSHLTLQALEAEQQVALSAGKQLPAFRSGDILEVTAVSEGQEGLVLVPAALTSEG